MSETPQSSFKLLFRTYDVRVVYLLVAQTITKGPYADIECKQETSGLLGSCRHAYGYQNTALKTGPLGGKKNIALLLYPPCRSMSQSRHLSLCCIVRRSRRNGYYADNPRCYKRRPTIREDTRCAANMSIP
ncbi:hypothetical protein TNCV_1598561 [Trichonephila clavipes]|nr:hypothetical protein TNCV_1598561 [Trichonephila clavipes]